MAEMKKYYTYLFWDYPELESMARKLSMEDFRQMIDKIKIEDPSLFILILRRFIERGSLTEGFQLFAIQDIEKGLKELHIWNKIPEIRLYAWKNAIEFMKKLKTSSR